MLDVLKRYQVPATFFLLGRNMPGNGDVVERIVAEGHTVANHSTTHPDLRRLTAEQVQNEMLTLENQIYEITGLRTALMRPPYGFVTDENIRQLQDLGYKIIKWTVDTNDWRDMDIDKVLINTMPNIRDGSIILMHDYLSQSVTKEVLPEIIHSLRSQGYTFVTVDELLGISPYK
jgi:peptidoglycan/xylan/chitin deacetylase (PgdA/CDA1 family)